jgi:hypothetical protein
MTESVTSAISTTRISPVQFCYLNWPSSFFVEKKYVFCFFTRRRGLSTIVVKVKLFSWIYSPSRGLGKIPEPGPKNLALQWKLCWFARNISDFLKNHLNHNIEKLVAVFLLVEVFHILMIWRSLYHKFHFLGNFFGCVFERKLSWGKILSHFDLSI